MSQLTAKSLYKTVAGLGLKPSQVRQLLPAWWGPEIENAADGLAELALHLSRRLSIDHAALLDGRLVPKGAVTRLAFKHRTDADPSTLAASSFIASSLSQALVAAMITPYRPMPVDGAALRRIVGERAPSLNFDALLGLCWSHGIPVIPLPKLPVGVRKMDGAALLVGDRPVIVIAKKKSSRAWLSFILAHEIGHIVLGHVSPGSSIVDISLQEASTYAAESAKDSQEAEADAFALDLMGGQAVASVIAAWRDDFSPVELAVQARQAGQQLGIEAGHLILRHAFATRRWPDAITALRFLSEDVDPERALIEHLSKNIDLNRVAEDLQDLVAQVTGLNG